MKNVLIHILLIALSFTMKAQHNSDYVQYMFNGLLLNPAYAGSNDALNVTALYRNQWLGFPGAPVSAALSAHSPLKNKKINVGGIIINDRFGVFNHTKASLIYAYRIKFLGGQLAFGLQAGIDSYTTDWNKINTSEAADPNFMVSGVRKIIPEAGAGTFYHTKNFYFGLSVPNLFTGSINPDMVSVLSTGCIIKLNENIRLKPSVLVKYINNSPIAPNISTTFYYKEVIGVGVGYTHNTSALAYLDIRLNDQLHFGYGYDYSLNAIQKFTSGSHEVMLRYLFRYKINAVNTRYF